MLIVEQKIGELAAIADRMVVVEDGAIAKIGSPAEMMQEPSGSTRRPATSGFPHRRQPPRESPSYLFGGGLSTATTGGSRPSGGVSILRLLPVRSCCRRGG